jgi:acetolactate synthase I/III small subunit
MRMQAHTIIELIVNNHPGVMSHVTGLFSRRAFNLEGILCASIKGGRKSRMYLLVNNNSTLTQIVKQLGKLYDVVEVKVRHDYKHKMFRNLHKYIQA